LIKLPFCAGLKVARVTPTEGANVRRQSFFCIRTPDRDAHRHDGADHGQSTRAVQRGADEPAGAAQLQPDQQLMKPEQLEVLVAPIALYPDQLLADVLAASTYPRQGAPYHGYYFRILTQQGPSAPGGMLDYVVKGKMIGGFALLAYPAQYANSGVMTFVVNHTGTVYQKDLGDCTVRLVKRTMLSIRPYLEEGGCSESVRAEGETTSFAVRLAVAEVPEESRDP
jgi:Protein of unknown function (DUF2950)/Protein of unknown function (DUF3300)